MEGKLVDAALALLGPLERRLMAAVWSGQLPTPFVVHDARRLVPELAYTTVMTTLSRLASKGLLAAEREAASRATHYRPSGGPADYLAAVSRLQVRRLRDRFGDRALAAFAAELDELSPEQLETLRRLAES